MSPNNTSKNKYPLVFKNTEETEQFVRDFLLNESNFFKENYDLLEKLNFPHINIGSNKSFLERQNKSLKLKIKNYERKFALLIDSADSNEKIFLDLIEWVQVLIKTKKINTKPHKFFELLNDKFQISAATVLILKNKSNKEFSKYEISSIHFLNTQIKNLSGTTFLKIPSIKAKSWLDFLNVKGEVLKPKPDGKKLSQDKEFPIKSGSMAIIPLKNSELNILLGVLIMVSKDEKKFNEDKGVVFLDSIAKILTPILTSKLPVEESSP